ncbi:UDP-N-acetylmuramoylalanine--D-glutamate ligase [Sphingomonas antarctica]|uniref:UDP-N-acetylmuramoyl-L-alanine--D-glutamate ligase n=1 Tax=Sphingomonas antarctica TaxID=2040274 RepID=UPI0039EC5E8C
MITSSTWRGKRFAVLGLARSGRATVDALLASGAEVLAWDSDEKARLDLTRHPGLDPGSTPPREVSPQVEKWTPDQVRGDGSLVVEDILGTDLTGFAAVIVSPGVPLNRHPIAAHAAKYGVPVIGDIELFAQARAELPPHKVVGITGTNGKSTTTALVHHILKTAGVPTMMGGNIGLPILGQEPLPDGGVYVLELSSYQIDLTFTLDCNVAVLLNVTPDHLDRYDGFEGYVASKARLFKMQLTGMAVITDVEGPTRQLLMSLRDRPIGAPTFPANDVHSLGHARPEGGRTWRPMVIPGEMPVGQKDWPSLQGPHNLQNAAAAIATCGILGLHADQIRTGLDTYPGLPHRMERVRTLHDVLYVNDSKATNADSTAPALAAYPAVRWILGGQAKTHDLDACAPHFAHVRSAHTIGEAGAMFADILRPHMPVEECGTLDVAVKSAASVAEAGDTVLLSPACASFDQFRDFEDRGDTFRRLVEAL